MGGPSATMLMLKACQLVLTGVFSQARCKFVNPKGVVPFRQHACVLGTGHRTPWQSTTTWPNFSSPASPFDTARSGVIFLRAFVIRRRSTARRLVGGFAHATLHS